MGKDFHNSTKNHLESLDSFEARRKFWLRMSGFVSLAVIGIICNWDNTVQGFFGWVISGLGFIIAVLWWCWTMRLIKIIIAHRREEAEKVDEIVKELNDIIIDFNNLPENDKSD